MSATFAPPTTATNGRRGRRAGSRGLRPPRPGGDRPPTGRRGGGPTTDAWRAVGDPERVVDVGVEPVDQRHTNAGSFAFSPGMNRRFSISVDPGHEVGEPVPHRGHRQCGSGMPGGPAEVAARGDARRPRRAATRASAARPGSGSRRRHPVAVAVVTERDVEVGCGRGPVGPRGVRDPRAGGAPQRPRPRRSASRTTAGHPTRRRGRQVHQTVRVTPLVVVPADHLDQRRWPSTGWTIVSSSRRCTTPDCRRCPRRRSGRRCIEDPIERPGLAAAANASFTSATDTAPRHERGEVGDRADRDRHPQRGAVELPLHRRQHEARGPCCAGRCRDDVDRGGAGPSEVLVRQVEEVLIVRVRVDGRHQPADDAEGVVDDLDHRHEAVRRARRVRDHDVVAGSKCRR